MVWASAKSARGGGSKPAYSTASSPSRAAQASAAAAMTVRRDKDRAASTGITANHGSRKDAAPPVRAAPKVTSPVRLTRDSNWAFS